GILIDGFRLPNCFDTTYNYPYYGEFLERYGFVKAKDYFAYSMDLSNDDVMRSKLSWGRRYITRIKERTAFETRCVTPESLRDDVEIIMEIYNDAWSSNWGFLPLTQAEVEGLAGSLKMFYDPGLVRLAFVSGEPAAMLGIIPDPNWCFRPLWKLYYDRDIFRVSRLLVGRRGIKRLRWFFFGVKQRFRNLGADMLLTVEALEYYLTRPNYTSIEGSLILEDNWQTIKALETIGMRRTKTWRIYDLPLK
ncbi:MAG: hypothetical protein N3E40_07125, partial [Dehalococcoidia bacterium]|nr:hypothetical protein [Dehalococcoidia bacterium]